MINYCDCFISIDNEFIYIKNDSVWHRHLIIPNTHRLYHTEYLLLHNVQSIRILPALIQLTPNSVSLLHYSTNYPKTLPEEVKVNIDSIKVSVVARFA